MARPGGAPGSDGIPAGTAIAPQAIESGDGENDQPYDFG
jgi:hypothetical protein